MTPGFDALYREHFGFVYASLLRLGVPSASIDDAVQDVYVTVHRRLPDFEGRSAVRSWLYGIVRRVAFRHRRSAQRVEHKLRALAVQPPLDVGLAEALESAQRSARLLRALDQLDDDKRAALTLHVFEELRGPEVAQLLGINVDTAYSRIKAARRELQRALVELGANDDEATLVAAARRETTADRGASRRVAAALALRLGTGAAKAVIAASTGYTGVVVAIALGAVAAVAIGLGNRSGPAAVTAPLDPPRVASTMPRPSSIQPAELDDARPAPAELTPVAKPTEEAPDAPIRVTPAHPRPSSPQPSVPPVDEIAAALAAEVAMITAAKTALDGGDSSSALQRLAEHARRFPTGQLVAERAGYRAMALCAAGREIEGRGEARVFIGLHPHSPLVARVARACDVSASDR